MTDRRLIRLSKALSLALRHRPEDFGLELDPEGYAPLEDVLAALRVRAPDLTAADVEAVVATVEPDKQRFTLREGWIRANYGHSLAARIAQRPAPPPPTLWHGTHAGALETVLREGLAPMSRQYVHLTTDPALALRVGGRRGRPVLLEVAAGRAHDAGVVFYEANARFWLVDRLGPEYLRRA